MLHIFLLILKTIGIILLCLFLIAILLLLIVLFVPIRYKIAADKNDKIKGKVTVSWICSIIRGSCYYEDDFNIIVRVFGIKVYDANKKKENERKKSNKTKENVRKKNSKTKEKERNKKKENERKKRNKNRVSENKKNDVQVLRTDSKQIKKENVNMKIEAVDSMDQTEQVKFTEFKRKHSKVKSKSKVKKIFGKIHDKLRNIRYTIQKMCAKIKTMFQEIEYYFELFQQENTQKAWGTAKVQIKSLWKNIKPGKISGTIVFGFDNPETMGKILTYHSILFPIIGNKLVLIPDFDHQIFTGNVVIKGRITIAVLVKVGVVIYFNKEIKQFLALLKKEDK